MERTYPSEHKDLLGQLLRDGTLSPALLDRLLGAYTIFEYRAGKCFRKQASESYLETLYRDKAAAQSFWDRDLMDAIHPEDREEFSRVLTETGTDRSHCRFRHILEDGSCIWLDLEIFLLKREADTALYCGILRDVTEELRTTADLESSRGALRTMPAARWVTAR